MTTSTDCLPDVSVWLALASRRHQHSGPAAAWMNGFHGRALFCRVTQAALLRLLTNPAAMGADALDANRAWEVYDRLLSDSRIGFALEPADLEAEWCALCTRTAPSAPNWTDSYLLAFARTGGLSLVTLDRSLARRDSGAVLLQPLSGH